jgi:hypothetical protein
MTTHVRVAVIAALGVCVALACSLNPQPLPPDNPDGSAASDGSLTNYGDDSGGAADGASETGSSGGPDGSLDASDAAADAEDSSTDGAADGDGDGFVED